MFGLGPQELLILAVIGVLFFGSNLPKLGRSLGRTIVEFRKGVSGVEDDIETATEAPSAPSRPPERLSPSAPKFEVDAAEPETAQQGPMV